MDSALRRSLSKGKRVVFFHGLLSRLIITSDLHEASLNVIFKPETYRPVPGGGSSSGHVMQSKARSPEVFS